MRYALAITVAIISISGCQTEPDLSKLISAKRITHSSGVLCAEIQGGKLLDLGNEFSLVYPANKTGRSDLVVSIHPLGKKLADTVELAKYEEVDLVTWIRESERKPGFEKRRKVVDIVRQVDQFWVRINVLTTIDLENARGFSLRFVDSIHVVNSDSTQTK